MTEGVTNKSHDIAADDCTTHSPSVDVIQVYGMYPLMADACECRPEWVSTSLILFARMCSRSARPFIRVPGAGVAALTRALQCCPERVHDALILLDAFGMPAEDDVSGANDLQHLLLTRVIPRVASAPAKNARSVCIIAAALDRVYATTCALPDDASPVLDLAMAISRAHREPHTDDADVHLRMAMRHLSPVLARADAAALPGAVFALVMFVRELHRVCRFSHDPATMRICTARLLETCEALRPIPEATHLRTVAAVMLFVTYVCAGDDEEDRRAYAAYARVAPDGSPLCACREGPPSPSVLGDAVKHLPYPWDKLDCT
jgi:hypothetical protein